MVSVKRASLPESYIEAAKQLIYALEGNPINVCKENHGYTVTTNYGNGYKIDYAFFYLRYDENQEWYDGSWWLVIASEEIDHDFDGIGKVLSVIKLLDIDLPEFDFVIEKPYLEEHKRIWDRIDIKVYPE